MSARIKRELVASVLAGKSVQGRAAQLLSHGLLTVETLVADNHDAILAATRARGARSWWVRHRMKHGVVLELCLHPPLGLLGKLRLRSKRVVKFARKPSSTERVELVSALSHRLGTDTEEILAALRAIERARKRALELTEEGSRWLV